MIKTKSRTKKILIVEDDEKMNQVYRSMFEDRKDKYEIEIVSDARVGYTELQSKKYDMIILDMIMKPMSGEEYYSCVRNDEKLKAIPVLVVSVVDPDSLQHLEKINNIGFLQKPITEEQLMQEIEKIIG